MSVLILFACLLVTANFTFADIWPHIQKLHALDGTASDNFGYSVAIDGDYAIIGAYLDSDMKINSGSAYIFKYDGTAWIQQAKLTAADGAASDYFGVSVSIRGDYAIVGAHRKNVDIGAAYIFYRNGTSWTQQAKLLAADAAIGDFFGWSVSIDGDYAIIGANRDNDMGNDSGSAYIFKRNGTTWTQQVKLTAADGAASDYFGDSVAIDGDYIIAGAYGDDDKGSYSGSAYIFKRDGIGWTQQAKLIASDGAASDYFGRFAAISGDYAIVGSIWDDDMGTNSGSAYIFKRDETNWTQQTKLLAADGVTGDCFGGGISIRGDYAVVGAYADDDNGTDSGSAYIFKRSGTTWAQQAKLTAADGAAEDFFGQSVSISTNSNTYSAIAGAYWDDDNGTHSGSAYMFEYNLDADLNRDHKVDLADFNELAAHWQQTGCPAGCEDADINGDGTVDMTDLLSLANTWLYGV